MAEALVDVCERKVNEGRTGSRISLADHTVETGNPGSSYIGTVCAVPSFPEVLFLNYSDISSMKK